MFEDNNRFKVWPLVTVMVITKDRLPYFEEAILSICNQSYPFIELVVVDDCSGWDIFSAKEKLINSISGSTIVRNATSSGAQRSRNSALFLSKGEFVTGLDDDDLISPSHVSSLLCRYYDLFIAEYNYKQPRYRAGIYPQQQYFGKVNKRRTSKPFVFDVSDLKYGNEIGNQVMFFRKDLIEIGDLFDTRLRCWQDLGTWLMLVQDYGFKFYSSGLNSYKVRVHEHQRITTAGDRRFLSAFNLLKRQVKEFRFIENFLLHELYLKYRDNNKASFLRKVLIRRFGSRSFIFYLVNLYMHKIYNRTKAR